MDEPRQPPHLSVPADIPTTPQPSAPRPDLKARVIATLRDPASLVWLLAPTAILILVTVGYGFYWSAAAAAMKREVAGWFAARQGEGYDAAFERLSVGGFPFRLEAELANPSIGMPTAPSAWRLGAPRVLINALPYNPNHIIVRVPAGADYSAVPVVAGRARADERRHYTIAAKSLRASARASAGRIVRLSLEADALTAAGERRFTDGETAPLGAFSLGHGETHLRETSDDKGAPALDLALDVKAFDWPDAPEGEGPLPTVLGALSVSGRFTNFPEPERVWSGAMSLPALLGEWSQEEGRLKVAAFDLAWGSLDITSAGDLGLAAAGTPEGRIDAKVKGLDALIDKMEKAGRFKPQEAQAYRGLLKTVKNGQPADEDGRLAIPVLLDEGRLFVGPAEVAALPALLPPR